MKIGSIYPHSFDLLVSITVLALIILGGMGSIPGVVVGALVLVGLPEILREFDEYRLLVYGAILVVMMLRGPGPRAGGAPPRAPEEADDADDARPKRGGGRRVGDQPTADRARPDERLDPRGARGTKSLRRADEAVDG